MCIYGIGGGEVVRLGLINESWIPINCLVYATGEIVHDNYQNWARQSLSCSRLADLGKETLQVINTS